MPWNLLVSWFVDMNNMLYMAGGGEATINIPEEEDSTWSGGAGGRGSPGIAHFLQVISTSTCFLQRCLTTFLTTQLQVSQLL